MFKMHCLYIIVCFLILLASAAPLDKDNESTIIYNNYSIDETGNYKFRFKTSNGIERDETGMIVNVGQPNEHIFVIGRYSYYNTEGQKVTVEYAADENGYIILPPGVTGTETAGVPGNVVATLLGK